MHVVGDIAGVFDAVWRVTLVRILLDDFGTASNSGLVNEIGHLLQPRL